MVDEFDTSMYEDDGISFGEAGRKEANSSQNERFTMDKGQKVRAALLYFHPVDVDAVLAAKRQDKDITREQMKTIALQALAERAKLFSKPVSELAPWQKLNWDAPTFKKTLTQAQQGVGVVISRLGKDGSEADAVWRRLPEAKEYFWTLLLLYPMAGGEVSKNNILTDWTIKPWRIAKTVWTDLWNLDMSLRSLDQSLATQDLDIVCTDKQYQKMKINFAGKAIWTMNQSFKHKVLEASEPYYDFKKLCPGVREITTDQLRVKLGLVPAPTAGSVSGAGTNYGSAVSSTNFEDMMDALNQ